jgi:hypothetical protein
MKDELRKMKGEAAIHDSRLLAINDDLLGFVALFCDVTGTADEEAEGFHEIWSQGN